VVSVPSAVGNQRGQVPDTFSYLQMVEP
jgi:hypothetical protein